MAIEIKTCLLKDYPSTIGFKFTPKSVEFANIVGIMDSRAAAIYLHRKSEDGSEKIELIAINFSLEFANIVASRLKPEDFIDKTKIEG